MSYILEALKKAESERECGQVPGLNTAQHSRTLRYGHPARPWWLLGLVLLLALAYGLWRQSGATLPNGALTSTPTPAASAATVAVAVPVQALPPAVAAPFSATPLSAVAHVQAKVVAAPTGLARDAGPMSAVPLEAQPKSAPPQAAGLPLLQELPDSLRRQIPALHISGAIYSDSPSEWTLIINDQVLAKGSLVAPELRLEEIGANSAVFNFRGQRFRLER